MEQPTFQFSWSSTLGISVILFCVMNFIYVLMGIVSPIFFKIWSHELSIKFGLGFSPTSDLHAFGKSTVEILKENPTALPIKTAVYEMFAGLYLAYAIVHFCLIWFGLMRGESWSLWALTCSNLAIIVFYLLAARTYSTEVTPLTFGDLMPYAIVPGMILPVASILGFIGLNAK